MSNYFNTIGLECAVAKENLKLNLGRDSPVAEGRFSLLTLLAMAESFEQRELYDYVKEKFVKLTGFDAKSYVKMLGSPEAPKWYNSLAGYVLGVVPEKKTLTALVGAGFDNYGISLLIGKERGETYKALIDYGLWGEYMKHHHSGRNWTNPRDAEIKELAGAGLPLKKIAEALGVTKQGASYLLHNRPEVYKLWKKARFNNK